MTVLVTQSRGLSDTDLINKTRKPENIEINKAMKYTKPLKYITFWRKLVKKCLEIAA